MKVGDIVEIKNNKLFPCFFEAMRGIIVSVDALGTPWADNWFMWHKVETERGTEYIREDMLKIVDESRNTGS